MICMICVWFSHDIFVVFLWFCHNLLLYQNSWFSHNFGFSTKLTLSGARKSLIQTQATAYMKTMNSIIQKQQNYKKHCRRGPGPCQMFRKLFAGHFPICFCKTIKITSKTHQFNYLGDLVGAWSAHSIEPQLRFPRRDRAAWEYDQRNDRPSTATERLLKQHLNLILRSCV